MGALLKIKKSNGSIANIPIISGESAYETAVRLGSYDGTEQEFAEGLAVAAEIGDAIMLPPTGSETRPVYIDNSHTIQPITHTIQSDVPANAVFTDTVYTLPTASSSILGGIKTGTFLSNTAGYTACPIDSNGIIYYKDTTYTIQANGGLGMTGTSFYLDDITGLTGGTIGNNTTTTLNFGDTIKVPKLTINSKGQTTSIEDISLVLPSAPTTYTLPTASSSTLGGVKTGTSLSSTTGYTACPVDSNGTIYYKNINIPKFNFTFTNTYYDSDNRGFETETNSNLTNFINYIDSFFVNSNPDITNNANTLDDNIYFELYVTGIPAKISYNNGPIFTSGTSTIKFNCVYETDNNDRYISGTFTQIIERYLVTYFISFAIYDTGADSRILVGGEIQSLTNLCLPYANTDTTGF